MGAYRETETVGEGLSATMICRHEKSSSARKSLDASSTKSLYDTVYEVGGHNYAGLLPGALDTRPNIQMEAVRAWLGKLRLGNDARVVEVGCGLGDLHRCHANWLGFEYSGTALRLAKQRHGEVLRVAEADARALPLKDESVDFLFSFATLEHVPEVELAFDEISRVVKPGGVAFLCPAWNCRPWTVKKLQQRPYSDLTIAERVGKFAIPLREWIVFRMVIAIPSRFWREFKLSLGCSVSLDYRRLSPDFSLWDRFPHVSDDDAFVSMDAHAALAYFKSRRWYAVSHPGLFGRLICRGGGIVVQKLA